MIPPKKNDSNNKNDSRYCFPTIFINKKEPTSGVTNYINTNYHTFSYWECEREMEKGNRTNIKLYNPAQPLAVAMMYDGEDQ